MYQLVRLSIFRVLLFGFKVLSNLGRGCGFRVDKSFGKPGVACSTLGSKRTLAARGKIQHAVSPCCGNWTARIVATSFLVARCALFVFCVHGLVCLLICTFAARCRFLSCFSHLMQLLCGFSVGFIGFGCFCVLSCEGLT